MQSYHMQIHLNSPLGFPPSVLAADAGHLRCLALRAAPTQELKAWDGWTAETEMQKLSRNRAEDEPDKARIFAADNLFSILEISETSDT